MSKRKKTKQTPGGDEATAVNVGQQPESGAQPAAPDDDAEISLEVLQVQLDHARAGLEDQREQFLRARADLENTRKRAENDVRSAHKFAVEKFAAEILAVRDSLELASAVQIDSEDAGALEKMREGLDLTLRQFDTAFAKFGIQAVLPEPGDKFDPDRHQAMSMQESADIEANHIVSVVQKGYLIHERLMRPAMVIVAKAMTAQEPAESAVSES